MQKILTFIKNEIVLAIAFAAAVLSMFFVPPDAAYAAYIDFDVLMLLFSLMAVVGGLKRCGVMDRICDALITRASSARTLCMLLSGACFFSAMLVTNDVALITFVPLTCALLSSLPRELMITVTIETIAANLGSMATPIGNPQNLYLYSRYAMPIGDFLAAVGPLTLTSLALVLLSCLLVKKTPLTANAQEKKEALPSLPLIIHGVQFVLCILSVLGVMPKWVSFIAVLVSTLLYRPALVREVDYALLSTFVCFFVFVGNLGRIDAVSGLLSSVIAGRTLETGLLASQVISNVPAALMLSGFTNDAYELLRGVNLGGLGTLVASLASLISFKLYAKAPGAKTGKYLAVFTAVNVAFLAVLYALAKMGL